MSSRGRRCNKVQRDECKQTPVDVDAYKKGLVLVSTSPRAEKGRIGPRAIREARVGVPSGIVEETPLAKGLLTGAPMTPGAGIGAGFSLKY